MFKKRKFLKKVARIMQACGGNFDNPSFEDNVVVVLFSILDRNNLIDEIPFSNKFVRSDAVILGALCAYAMYVDRGSKFAELLLAKVICGASKLYGIDYNDYKTIMPNRVGVFQRYAITGDMETFIHEAANLFTYDLSNSKYEIFHKNTPISLIGIDEQMLIEIKTQAYFVGVISALRGL